MARIDGRAPEALRPVRITPHYLKFPEGSVLVEMGETKVICTASIEETVPFHKKGTGTGWVTAEYAMLPRSTMERTPREIARPRGRSQEIQRLIGRSLRSVTNLSILGERTITLDCDVIQADGGTRTAAITGAYVALHQAVKRLMEQRVISKNPLKGAVAAVSVGMIGGQPVLDLSYAEDSKALVDMNVVMTEQGQYVEVQGTGEQETFTGEQLNQMLELAKKGIRELIAIQKTILK